MRNATSQWSAGIPANRYAYVLSPARSTILSLIYLLLLLLIAPSAFAGPSDPIKKPKIISPVVGGDFSLDFVASAPLTYVHSVGGGAYDDRTIGRNLDVVESLEGGDFKCGDHVSYLTAIKVSASASGNQTIKLDYSFLAASTGQPGVALGAFTFVGVNSGAVVAGDGPGGTDMGHISNGNESASLDGGYPGTVNGTLFQKPATLDGVVTISGLEPGEQVIVRIDVLIKCQIPSAPTGNLQANIKSGQVTSPSFNKRDATISVGNQTVPFKNVNLIGQADCSLNDYTSACVDQILTYTAGTSISSPVRTWSLSGAAIFVDNNGDPVSDPGDVATVNVKATNAASASFTVSVIISATQHDPATCSDVVTVNPIPSRPSITYNPPACNATTFSITVTAPLDGGGVDYEYSNDGGTSWQDGVTFSGIAAGAGFSVTVRAKNATSCVSAATTCANYQTSITAATITPETNAIARNMAQPEAGAKTRIKAFPNPYNDIVQFEIMPLSSGRGTLEIYNTMGQKLASLNAGALRAGQSRVIEYKVPAGARTALVYYFTVGGEKVSGKLLPRSR